MTIIKGDLLSMALEGSFDIIAHGCNCLNNMGAGIAKQIKKQFPEAFYADGQFSASNLKDKQMMMGSYSSAYHMDGENPRFWILNLYTQLYPGAPSPGCIIPFDYEAFITCLRKVNRKYPGLRIGLPWIGCGLAGANKEKVSSIINVELNNMYVTIVDYEDNQTNSGSVVGAGLGDATTQGEVHNTSGTTGDGGQFVAGGDAGGSCSEGDKGFWAKQSAYIDRN